MNNKLNNKIDHGDENDGTNSGNEAQWKQGTARS